MSSSFHYFSNAAADISYCPAGYLRTTWHSMAAEPAELRAIYEHVLRAMQRYQVSALLFVHEQAEPIPVSVQNWLTSNWIPRAVEQAGYQRCAVVESGLVANRQATHAIGQRVAEALEYAFFEDADAASAWLLAAA